LTDGQSQAYDPTVVGSHSATRDVLLDAVVAFVRERGVSGWSLRELAAACGTTHSHLLYHFGSRERLLVEAMVEYRRRFNLDLKPGTAREELADEVRRAFPAVADRRLDDFRLFFYVAGLALQNPELNGFFTGIVSAWVDVPGAGERERARRRVALAALRGLLLDLLATGERADVDRAVEELVEMLSARRDTGERSTRR
jgi:AcrR family transcriptional regulator